jgi:hypothetical protein
MPWWVVDVVRREEATMADGLYEDDAPTGTEDREDDRRAREMIDLLPKYRSVLQRIAGELEAPTDRTVPNLLVAFLELWQLSYRYHSFNRGFGLGTIMAHEVYDAVHGNIRTIDQFAPPEGNETLRLAALRKYAQAVGRDVASLAAIAFTAPEFLELAQQLAATKA